MIGLLTAFGVEIGVGSTVGSVLGWLLVPRRVTVSRNVLKAAIAGLSQLSPPERAMTEAELESMARNAIFD